MSEKTEKGTAVVTGASTGIGAVYADRFARRGYDLFLTARSLDKLEEVAESIRSRSGRRVEVLKTDLTRAEDAKSLSERLASDSSITALINNAGVGTTAKLLDSKVEDMESMIYLNVTVLTRLTMAVLPGFAARGNGLIINIASIAALAPDILNGTYSGTKAYVVNFTQALHGELDGKGVTVQAVLPGAIATPFWDKAGISVAHLPSEIVMQPEHLVDAALSGLDKGELITLPSLPDIADWEKLDQARKALGPNLSHVLPAARYEVAI